MGVNMNKPVAWMYEKSNGASKLSFVKEKMLWEDMTETPLYTHLAKTQEPDCYGDGNVYRGVRNKDSEIKTYVFDKHAGKQVWSNPAKTLTDEEIEVLASKHLCYQIEGSEVSGVFDFARAILRKAQDGY
jgi:outer membrane protein assembly factor BamB